MEAVSKLYVSLKRFRGGVLGEAQLGAELCRADSVGKFNPTQESQPAFRIHKCYLQQS